MRPALLLSAAPAGLALAGSASRRATPCRTAARVGGVSTTSVAARRSSAHSCRPTRRPSPNLQAGPPSLSSMSMDEDDEGGARPPPLSRRDNQKPRMLRRWKVVGMMAAAFVLCNMVRRGEGGKKKKKNARARRFPLTFFLTPFCPP